MNRNQRRLGRVHQKRNFDQERKERHRDRDRYERHERQERQGKSEVELEEVLPPKATWGPPKLDKFTTNKCCFVTPTKEDFGQLTDNEEPAEKYQKILNEQYGFDPFIPETINQLKELRKVLCENVTKVENSSQYVSDKKLSAPEFPETFDGSRWQNIDNADEIDKYIRQDEGKLDQCLYLPENIHICEVPRIKIIARKYSRFRKNNVELRKMDEKVVCVEYDVFIEDCVTPVEKLRAFFSIKPMFGKDERENEDTRIPSKVRNNFNISNEDLKQLNEKEIEIIDGKISENKTYLEDLKRILRRKQAINAKKNKTSLDLMSLYEMAKRESPPLDDEFSNTNFLSKAELQEMKDLILRKCASSVQGINRRTIKGPGVMGSNMGVVSQSIIAELMRGSDITTD